MWSTEDESCVEMAREFYGRVKDGFAKKISSLYVFNSAFYHKKRVLNAL